MPLSAGEVSVSNRGIRSIPIACGVRGSILERRLIVPNRIPVILFPKLNRCAFRPLEGPFPEFPRILEKAEHECATHSARLRRSPPREHRLDRAHLPVPGPLRNVLLADFPRRGLDFRRLPEFAEIWENAEHECATRWARSHRREHARRRAARSRLPCGEHSLPNSRTAALDFRPFPEFSRMLEEAEPEDATPWAIPQPTQPGPRRAVLVDHFPGPTRLTHPTVAFSSVAALRTPSASAPATPPPNGSRSPTRAAGRCC